MPGHVRSADVIADRLLLTGLLVRNLGPTAGEQRFDWLYQENPYGRARVWIAVEPETQQSVGSAAAFPRQFCVEGTIRLGYVLGDFCIDQQHRSLGLALQLQRACLEQLLSTGTLLSYDFPSDRMMAVYRRMGVAPKGQIARWAKPLGWERQLRRVVTQPALARLLAAPLNKLMEWTDPAFSSTGGWEIAEHPTECQEEFTELANRLGSRYGTCVYRSADYLNWRYLRHPFVRYELLTARRGGELMGYAIVSQRGKDAAIVDLFGFPDTSMCSRLLAQVVLRLRARSVSTLSAAVLASNPWTGLLKTWGFRPREQSPVVVWEPDQDSVSPWFLMDGDRES